MTARIRLIGGVAVESGTGTLDSGLVTAGRARRILAALVDVPAGLTGPRLAERVWSEPPSTWPSALRGAIASLRTALDPIGLGGGDLIVTTRTGWALAPGATSDLRDAEAAVEAAEEALDRGSTAGAIALRTEIAHVLEGELLPDEDADWLRGLRERHDRVVDRARHAIAEAAMRAGRFPLALEQADALLLRSPVDETAHRLRIRGRRAIGDRAGAIEAFERCRTVLAAELGTDPAAETTALYLETLQSGSNATGGLPALPVNGFFGRSDEVAAIVTALQRPGLVEVVGRGGVGKSRLVLHVAHEAVAAFEGGRFWASLGDLAAGELVPVAVAAAVGADEGADPLGAAIALLAPLGPVLLVLDGCEPVADAALAAAVRLLEAVPALRVVATSRTALSPTTVHIAVQPLTAGGSGVERSPAVRLLGDRVASRGGRLRLDDRGTAGLVALCERCEGVPLALEIAAAQLASMAVDDLLDELDRAAEGVDGVLGSMLDQARASFDPEELAVFDRLALVDGGVPLALVRGLSASAVPTGRAPRVLAALEGAGMVVVDRSGARWRYGLDDELRRLVRERTEPHPDAFAGLADALDAVAPADATVAPDGIRDGVDDAADGFRTLFRAAAEGRADLERALDLAYRLHRYWTIVRLQEGRYWLGRLLEHASPGPAKARARFAAGYLGYWAAAPAALPLLRTAADELEEDAPAVAARALIYSAGLADDLDLVDEAREDVLRSVTLAHRAGGAGLIAAATAGVGSILAERGDPAATGWCSDALAALGPDTPPAQRHAVLANCARLAWQVGASTQARAWADEARPLLDGAARIAKVQLVTTIAALDLQRGALDEATAHIEAATATADELGVERELPLVLATDVRIRLAAGQDAEARRAARRCIEVVRSLSAPGLTAVALESAGLALAPDRSADPLLRAAAALRSATRRPTPAPFRIDPVPDGPTPTAEVALEEAAALLA